MSDRELMELVAKALGTELLLLGEKWNPLTDDGDALRLAVKLEIAINPFAGKTVVSHEGPSLTLGHEKWDCHDDDPYAATRRAITRAAAEIGRTMP